MYIYHSIKWPIIRSGLGDQAVALPNLNQKKVKKFKFRTAFEIAPGFSPKPQPTTKKTQLILTAMEPVCPGHTVVSGVRVPNHIGRLSGRDYGTQFASACGFYFCLTCC
jgi:hypothetical protein